MALHSEGAVRKKRKLTRAEQNEQIKLKLFNAAATLVGKHGYAECSVARITELAGVAQGTFYNHFENRQAILDRLLPTIGEKMLDFIRDRVDPNLTEELKERARFRAFFEFLIDRPDFLRILNEAEYFAPKGHAQHFGSIVLNYLRALKKGRRSDKRMMKFSDPELEVVVHILLGVRSYLGRYSRQGKGRVKQLPEHVLDAYAKLLSGGLFDSSQR